MSDLTESTMREIWMWLDVEAASYIHSDPEKAVDLHNKSMMVEDCWHELLDLQEQLLEVKCLWTKSERRHGRAERILKSRLAAVSDVVAEFRSESDSRKYIDYQGHCVQDMCANRVEEALF